MPKKKAAQKKSSTKKKPPVKTRQQHATISKKATSSKKNVRSKEQKPKKRKLRFGRIFFVLFLLSFLIFLLIQLCQFPIRNIYVQGNTLLSDQEIIELARISEYPSIFAYTSREMASNIEKNTYIENAKVTKKNLKEIYITVSENIPLFYDQAKDKTILKDQTEVEGMHSQTILLNYVPDTLYDVFITKLGSIDVNIRYRISEIKYDPNDVDEERFLLTMTDGNYVYLTMKKFDKINHYVEIMKEVLTKYKEEKGILFLDEGEYFEVFKK